MVNVRIQMLNKYANQDLHYAVNNLYLEVPVIRFDLSNYGQWVPKCTLSKTLQGYGIRTPSDLYVDTIYLSLLHLNPFKPNEISHNYQMEHSISILRVVGWYMSFLFKF